MGFGVLALAATAVRWGAFPPQATAAAELVSVASMAMVVLVQAFREGPVTVYRSRGGRRFLLLGLAWSLAFESWR